MQKCSITSAYVSFQALVTDVKPTTALNSLPAAAPLHPEPEQQLYDLEVADARGQVEHRLPLRVPLVEIEGQLELELA